MRKLAKKFHSPRTVRVCADAQSRPHEKYLPCTRSIDHHGEMIMKFIFETQDNTETQLFLLDNNHSSNELWTITVSDILASGGTRVHESRQQLSWYINDAFRSDTVSPFPYQRNMLRKRLVSVLHLWECRPWAHLAGPCSIPSVSYELLQITAYMDFEPPFWPARNEFISAQSCAETVIHRSQKLCKRYYAVLSDL